MVGVMGGLEVGATHQRRAARWVRLTRTAASGAPMTKKKPLNSQAAAKPIGSSRRGRPANSAQRPSTISSKESDWVRAIDWRQRKIGAQATRAAIQRSG